MVEAVVARDAAAEDLEVEVEVEVEVGGVADEAALLAITDGIQRPRRRRWSN
jgi:hypothetical protein